MIQQSLFDLYETEVLPSQEAAHHSYLEGARAWARAYGANGRLVCVNDVRKGYGPPPPGRDPRLMGAIFLKSEWEMVERNRTTRKACHNRPIAFFRLIGTRSESRDMTDEDIIIW
jgi:hypothetical protein